MGYLAFSIESESHHTELSSCILAFALQAVYRKLEWSSLCCSGGFARCIGSDLSCLSYDLVKQTHPTPLSSALAILSETGIPTNKSGLASGPEYKGKANLRTCDPLYHDNGVFKKGRTSKASVR